MEPGRSTVNSGLKVVRWGNSLAIRLPADLVQELNLKEGDFVGLGALLEGRLKLDARKASGSISE